MDCLVFEARQGKEHKPAGTDGACHLETAMITIVHEKVPPASIPMVDWCFGFNDTFGTIALYRGC